MSHGSRALSGYSNYASFNESIQNVDNPYFDYVDYYIMINGRNRRVIHRCGIEDYFKKRLFDGINLNPYVDLEQYYGILIQYVKGVYEEIINHGIFYPKLDADMSARLIIKRILRELIGDLETNKVMMLWDINKCNQCLRG